MDSPPGNPWTTCAARAWSGSGTRSTGKLVRTLRGHSQNVMGVAFSPDGRTLASVSGSWLTVPQAASRPGELILWNARDRRADPGASRPRGPTDGRGLQPRRLPDRDLELGPDGEDLGRQHAGPDAVAGRPPGLGLQRGLQPRGAADRLGGGRRGHQDLGDRRRAGALSRSAATPSRSPAWPSAPTAGAWPPPARTRRSSSGIAASDPEAITWRGAGGPIARIAYFPDGRRLLVAGNTEDAAGRVHPRLTILDVAGKPRGCESSPVPAPGASDRTIDGIAIRPDGGMVAAVSQYGGIEAWTVPDGQSCFRYDEPTNRFQAVAFSPDGRILAAAGQFGARSVSGEHLASDTSANGLVIALRSADRRDPLADRGDRRRASSATSPSAPTARPSPRPITSPPSPSSTRQRAASSACSAATSDWFPISRSAPTDGGSPRPAGIRR